MLESGKRSALIDKISPEIASSPAANRSPNDTETLSLVNAAQMRP